MLFYFVATHKGITKALPHMPHGIQQPALSGQMKALEEGLGVKLFVREPFSLTPAGYLLYLHLRPFFGPLAAVLAMLKESGPPKLSIGASEIVICEYMPAVIAKLRTAQPDLAFSLQSGTASELLTLLKDGKIDVVIAGIDRPSPVLASRVLVRLPPVLLAPASMRGVTAKSILVEPAPTLPLVCPSGSEALCRRFDSELRTRGLTWRPSIDVSSIAVVSWYVAAGHGVGLTLDLPKLTNHAAIQRVPLEGFGAVDIAALWRAPATAHVTMVLEALEATAGVVRESVSPFAGAAAR